MKKIYLIAIILLIVTTASYGQNTFPSTGNVGIGTTSPLQALDVRGSLRLPMTNSSGVGAIYTNGDSFLHNYAPTGSDGYNLFLGGNAGNFTMTLGGGASYFASGNVGLGYFTLQALTTGFDNAAFGVISLQSNTTGFSNLAIGSRSLISNTTGYQNTGIGTYSSQQNTTGWGNVAIGYDAGANTPTPLRTNNNCVFVGYLANSTVDGLTNSIAIGSSTQVTQSNQVILGNSSITQTLLQGNVAIGTNDPKGYKLAVNGSAIATSVTVKLNANWPDYVFKPNYSLPSLAEVKTYIDKNQHLPEMPSEQEIARDGLNLGEMNKLLVKKVEELTLYLIEKDKQIAEDQKKWADEELYNRQQEERIQKLEAVVEKMTGK